MFEYLMPLLVMRAYPGTLLDETYHAVVERQIEYGAQRGVPWGISESAYNAQDLDGNYQYRAFGVPGLGLKRGLADDLVVAPYATRAGGAARAARRASRNLRAAARARAWPGATASTRRSTTRRSGCRENASGGVVAADLHGAPPGHEPARARQRC